MAQNDSKNQSVDKKNKPVFIRGIKPSTKEWLNEQINADEPSLPKVVKRIVEDEHRRQTGNKRK
jgi:hypothetical protein